jgi:hypothetical protein
MTTTAACSGSATTDGLSPTIEDTSNSALTAQQPSSTGVALVEATDLTDVIATLMPAGRVTFSPPKTGSSREHEPSPRHRLLWSCPTMRSPDGSSPLATTHGSPCSMTEQRSKSMVRTSQSEHKPLNGLPPTIGTPISSNGHLESSGLGRELFSDPIPVARIVTDGSRPFSRSRPTDRYPHGVLGDELGGPR